MARAPARISRGSGRARRSGTSGFRHHWFCRFGSLIRTVRRPRRNAVAPLVSSLVHSEPGATGARSFCPRLRSYRSSAQPVTREPAPPELVTKALPVTFMAWRASRHTGAEFSSSLTAASDVQIPPPAALPLRPAIVFGPSPAPTRLQPSPLQPKEVQPTSPVQASPIAGSTPDRFQAGPVPAGRPQPTPSQPKLEEPSRSSVVPAPKPVPIKRQAASETERNAARFSSAAQRLAHAAIPSMRPCMEATESAWSKLSTGLKIGVAAAVIVGVSGIAYLGHARQR